MQTAYFAAVRLYRALGAILVIALIALLFVNIVLRAGFGIPIVWANEVALVLFVWVVFVGAGVSFAENARIRFTLLIDMLPSLGNRLIGMLVTYLGFAVLACFWAMSLYMAWAFRHQRFTSINVSVMWEWAAPPVGIALAAAGWIWAGQWTLRARPRATEPSSNVHIG